MTATFELTGPDGDIYHIDAPDEGAALSAFGAFAGLPAGSAAPGGGSSSLTAMATPPDFFDRVIWSPSQGSNAATPGEDQPRQDQPDKYQQAALDERNRMFPGQDPAGSYRNGWTSDAGATRMLEHGVTLGADSTILAAMETPLEMLKRGTWDPSEGYNYAKAREDLILNEARRNTGWLGTGAETLGGVFTGTGVAKAGVTAARFLSPADKILLARGELGVIPRALTSAADSAGLGAFSGAMEGNGLQERAKNALVGGGYGGLLGALRGAAPPDLPRRARPYR